MDKQAHLDQTSSFSNAGMTRLGRSQSRVRSTLACACALASCLGLGSSAAASESSGLLECGLGYEVGASYPALSTDGAASLGGEAGLLLYLEPTRALVELDACLYTVDGTVELELEGLDYITAWIELPPLTERSTLIVTRNGEHTDTMEVRGGHVSLTLTPGTSYALNLVAPGEPRPIKPLVVLEPSSDNPAP